MIQVPVGFLEKMREFEFPHLDRLITIVDLIDAPLDMSGIEKLPERIQSVVAWDAHQSFPWINWHVATLAAGHSSPGAQHYSSIGATIFLLTLPGTVSVHYGDEINLHGPKQGKVEVRNCFEVRWCKGTSFYRVTHLFMYLGIRMNIYFFPVKVSFNIGFNSYGLYYSHITGLQLCSGQTKNLQALALQIHGKALVLDGILTMSTITTTQ